MLKGVGAVSKPCCWKLEDFRQHYLMQRRLQISADLQAPQDFLGGYQAFLAQVAIMKGS